MAKKCNRTDDKCLKKSALWKKQYKPRLKIIRAISTAEYAKLIKKPIHTQIAIIDRLQAKGTFDRLKKGYA